MKSRIIVASICLPGLFAVILFLPPWAFGILMGIIAAISAVEFVRTTAAGLAKRVQVYIAAAALAIPILFGTAVHVATLTGTTATGAAMGLTVALILLLVLAAEAVFGYGTKRAVSFGQIAFAFFAGAVIPLFLGTLVSLRTISAEGFLDGRVYVFLPIVIAFTTDAGAYFTGIVFGKRKLCPLVSPKKTVAGAIGGFVVGLLCMLGFAWLMHSMFEIQINLLSLVILSIVGSAVTQLGDLAFSLIKREFDKKDFGNLLPGHGGMMDRFDSMVMLAPLALAITLWLPPFLY